MKKAFVILLASLSVLSCGQKVEDRIIGKWAEKGDPAGVIEFFENKTGVIGEILPVTWVVLDGDRLKLKLGEKMWVAEEVQVSKTEMTWKGPDGHTTTYRRVE